MVEDYAIRFRAVDVIGLPIGVLTQLVLIPLIYLPLRGIWPDTFSDDRLSETAEDLVDRATGGAMVLLVLMVCVGAPIVEELVYRGLLQRSFAARFSHVLGLARRLGVVCRHPLPSGRVPGPVRLRSRRRRLPSSSPVGSAWRSPPTSRSTSPVSCWRCGDGRFAVTAGIISCAMSDSTDATTSDGEPHDDGAVALVDAAGPRPDDDLVEATSTSTDGHP